MAAPLIRGSSLITGAASGIGRATAVAFARHGSPRIALLDKNESLLKTTTDELRQDFPDTEFLPVPYDAASEESTVKATDTVISSFGRLHHAVNNAGFPGPLGPSTSVTTDDFRALLDVNLTGVWTAQREQIKHMLKQDYQVHQFSRDRGTIVNISSMWGLAGTRVPPMAAYGSSKWGVISITKSDANQYAEQGIRINAILPGYIETPIMKLGGPGIDEIKAWGMDRTPMKRLGDAMEVANAIMFLSSPLATYISGAQLSVDGGITS